MWTWWKLNVPKSYELICRSCFPHERCLHPGTHPQSSGGQGEEGGAGLAAHMHSIPDSVLLQQREVKRVYHAQWHFQMQLSWGPLLIASVAHTEKKKEIHNFVKVVDHNLPLLLQNHHQHTLIALIDTDFMHISVTAVFLMHMWKGP